MKRLPIVEIDNRSGFCNGVVSAIRKAEEELDAGTRPLYCLGDIVHNSDEVERLCAKGLVTISHADLDNIADANVLLRAHGEPPSTYSTARRNNINIIDATCPVVLALQRRIKETFTTSPETQIVIYGKSGHAEVNGLVGQTDSRAIVVEDIAGLDRVDFNRDIALYSQTTMALEGFRAMIEEIKRRKAHDTEFTYHDTICRQVANRVDHLRDFARSHDVIIFVSGAKSSNGRVLYNECLSVNPASILVSNASGLDRSQLGNAGSIGICGATSTPRWLMEQVRDTVISLLNEEGEC